MIEPKKEPEKTKEQIIKECGTLFFSRTTDPRNGEPKEYLSYCNFWRECETCFQRRIEEHEGVLRDLLAYHGKLYYAEIPHERTPEFARKTNGTMYMRYPHDNFAIVLFVETDYEFSNGRNVKEFTLDDVGYFVKTAEKRRISGRMYTLNGSKNREGEISVWATDYRIRPHDRQKAKECHAIAIARSADWRPNADTLQFAMDARADLYREELRKAGIPILEVRKAKCNLNRDEIKWTSWTDIHAVSNKSIGLLVYNYRDSVEIEEMPTTSMDIGTRRFLKGTPKPT